MCMSKRQNEVESVSIISQASLQKFYLLLKLSSYSTQAVENAEEAVLEVDCNNITNISSAMEQYKTQFVQTLVQERSDNSISLGTASLAVQLLPDIDAMECRLSEERSQGMIGDNHKAWVAAFISKESRHLVCSLL